MSSYMSYRCNILTALLRLMKVERPPIKPSKTTKKEKKRCSQLSRLVNFIMNEVSNHQNTQVPVFACDPSEIHQVIQSKIAGTMMIRDGDGRLVLLKFNLISTLRGI